MMTGGWICSALFSGKTQTFNELGTDFSHKDSIVIIVKGTYPLMEIVFVFHTPPLLNREIILTVLFYIIISATGAP